MQKIIIKKYEKENLEEWENFVLKSNNGTIFHLQRFLEYHIEGKFDFSSYMIYYGGKLVAVLPGGYKNGNEIYWSPLGASYGSLVTGDLHFELALSIVDALISFFREQGTKELFLIPPPLIYSRVYNQHIEYAMLYRKFDFEYHYISHCIDLNIDYKKQYNRTTKRYTSKINKNTNLKIVQKNDFNTFYPILVENKLKHNTTPTHSLNDLCKLDQLLPDKLKLFLAFYDDIPIGGQLLFLTNSNVSLCFYNAISYKYKKEFPAYALVEHVID